MSSLQTQRWYKPLRTIILGLATSATRDLPADYTKSISRESTLADDARRAAGASGRPEALHTAASERIGGSIDGWLADLATAARIKGLDLATYLSGRHFKLNGSCWLDVSTYPTVTLMVPIQETEHVGICRPSCKKPCTIEDGQLDHGLLDFSVVLDLCAEPARDGIPGWAAQVSREMSVGFKVLGLSEDEDED